MERQIRDADDLKKALDLESSYFITITLADKEFGKLHHYFISKDFEKLDMLPSLKMVKGLVVEKLEGQPEQNFLPEF